LKDIDKLKFVGHCHFDNFRFCSLYFARLSFHRFCVMFACVYIRKISEGLSLADFGYAFSPLLEETARDTIVIDVDGCELLFGSAYGLANEIARRALNPTTSGGLACKVNVALAGNPDTAIQAAKFLKGITFISPGEEIVALGDLPITSLCSELVGIDDEKKKPASRQSREEILETLRLWGIRTFQDFAALPTAGVSERLGQAGVRLQQLARGKTQRHLKLLQPPPVFENSIELEHPLAELEPLSFLLARLLNQLCAKLNAYALATHELRLQMKLENGSFHDRRLNLPYAMRDHKVFLKLLLLDTEMHPPPAAIVALSLACEPVKPRVTQNGLFIPLAPEPEKLELTLARLTKLLGEGNLGSPELLDTHRPDAFRVKRFALKEKVNRRKRGAPRVSVSPCAPVSLMGFRVFRPPLRALIDADKGYPTQISAWSSDRSVHGKIVRLAGPWRATGDWWRADSWARDEWDVAVESRSGGKEAGPLQVLYRIYRELRNGMWFVAGIYD
jgi:protein ImuB